MRKSSVNRLKKIKDMLINNTYILNALILACKLGCTYLHILDQQIIYSKYGRADVTTLCSNLIINYFIVLIYTKLYCK